MQGDSHGSSSRSSRISTLRRESLLGQLESESFDLVVVGGGITGAGIAREATLRGLSVALLEASDFAAGTSSRSSKLIHGGLRYLAQGEVGLVRETALERKRVRALAPHLAEPCWMVVPARSRAGLMKFRAGIATYEKLGAVENEDLHRNWLEAELAEHEPALSRSRYFGACAYREYRTDDARLVLANLRAAARRGALVVNHMPVVGLLRDAGRLSGVEARCAQSGRSLRVRGRAVVNAAGPWVEEVRRLAEPGSASRLHLSRGIHVVVPAARLPLHNPVVLPAPDGRSIFAIPHADCVYVGTTDVSHAGGPELWPEAPREEVEYLLAPLSQVFDVAPISPEECRAAWAGLRPLIAQPGKPAREISRRDEIWVSDEGLVSIAGGKLTGYRRMAEQVVERVGQVLGTALAPASDAMEPLPGGDFDGDLAVLAHGLAQSAGIEVACSARLVRLYGSEAAEVVATGAAPLVPGGRVLAGELDWAVDCEGAATLEDWVYRRSRVALYDADECRTLLAPAAARLQERLGWSHAHRDEELARVRTRLDRDLGFTRAGSRRREGA